MTKILILGGVDGLFSQYKRRELLERIRSLAAKRRQITLRYY
ncbi:hypothetical protein [Vibrio sp. RE86]|nr:hypothetical protein [Vibrio sp. RE86]